MRRKEIVIQRDITDCGPCCLLSIISHYNGYVPLEKIRLDTYADHRGTNAYNLIEASKAYGFDATGEKHQNLDDVKILPCIAHVILDNGLNHYVVIYEIKSTKLIIMDPAKGKVTMSKEDFLNIWDNIIITFHPKHKIIKYPVQKNIISFFIKLVLEDKNRYFKIIILSIIITILNLLFNFYLKIGNYLNVRHFSLLNCFALFSFILFIKNSLTFFHGIYYIKLNNKVHKSLISDFIFHIFSLPSNLLQNKTSGEIITRVNELNDIKDLLAQLVIGIILDGLLVINSGIVLLFLNKQITMYMILALFCYFIISYISARKTNYQLHKWINKDTIYNETLLDTIDMYPSINNLQIKPQILDNLSYRLSEKIDEDIKLKTFLGKVNFLKGLVSDGAILLLNTFALMMISSGKMAMMDFIVYNTIFIYLFNSFASILNIMPEYYYLKNTIYKISEFKNLEVEKDEGIKSFTFGDLKVSKLSYSYNNDNKVINNLNLTFKKGKNYFISGPSGSGKSTLLRILYKDINNYKGNITINDCNYKDINLNSIRDNITFVNQKEKLFSGTIYQNIKCFRNINDKDFDIVCKICLIDKIVEKKPLRYLSNIKDALTNLSGGEKQQIILARNLLKNGSIIIIDEALSEVDIKTEKEIINNIKKKYWDKTIIYVSHKNLSGLFENSIAIS